MELDVFGVSVQGAFIIVAVCCVLSAIIFGVNTAAIVISAILSLGAITLIGRYGLRIPSIPVKAILYPIAVLAGLILLFLLLSVAVNLFYGLTGQGNSTPVSAGPGAATSTSTQTQTRQLYHGTSRRNAREIYNTGFWLVGESEPHGVYITDKFEVAKQYSGNSGAIVVIRVDSKVRLTDRSNGIYLYEVPDAVPFDLYHKIEGLEPVNILDAKGNSIT